MKAAAWSIAVLAGALALPAGAASDIAPGGSVRAHVDFAISIPRVAQLRLVNHPAAIDVTAADIARGLIVVSGASLDLLVNDPTGYVLRVDVGNGAFSAARIVNLPARMPSMVGKPKPAPMPVDYEITLSPDAQPGRFAWPVSVTIQP